MKTYRVLLENRVYYGFDVEAETRADAMMIATNRMESGDWGREEYGKVDIFDMEESDDE